MVPLNPKPYTLNRIYMENLKRLLNDEMRKVPAGQAAEDWFVEDFQSHHLGCS